MKFIPTLFFLLSFFAIQAQSISYAVECPKPDSCFLSETSIGQATAQEPRPRITISYRLFRSQQEFDLIVEQIRKAANAEVGNGVDRSRNMNAIADKIQAAKPKQ